MADVLVSQAALYLLIGYLFRTLNRKHRDRNTSDLQRALITRQANANLSRRRFGLLEMLKRNGDLSDVGPNGNDRSNVEKYFGIKEISQECFQYPGYVILRLRLELTLEVYIANVTRRDANDNLVTVEIVPSGEDIPVTDGNKHDFAERWLHYFLLESVSDQLYRGGGQSVAMVVEENKIHLARTVPSREWGGDFIHNLIDVDASEREQLAGRIIVRRPNVDLDVDDAANHPEFVRKNLLYLLRLAPLTEENAQGELVLTRQAKLSQYATGEEHPGNTGPMAEMFEFVVTNYQGDELFEFVVTNYQGDELFDLYRHSSFSRRGRAQTAARRTALAARLDHKRCAAVKGGESRPSEAEMEKALLLNEQQELAAIERDRALREKELKAEAARERERLAKTMRKADESGAADIERQLTTCKQAHDAEAAKLEEALRAERARQELALKQRLTAKRQRRAADGGDTEVNATSDTEVNGTSDQEAQEVQAALSEQERAARQQLADRQQQELADVARKLEQEAEAQRQAAFDLQAAAEHELKRLEAEHARKRQALQTALLTDKQRAAR
eukprot:jgi/Phyca11/20134/fgenesh1_pg.PHYCAscaffold_58_\